MKTIFFSYSHADEELRNRLEKHLAVLRHQGLVELWHDRRIAAGSEFNDEISDKLEAADIILLLISSDFLASEYCYSREMRRAMERHEAKEAIVIPVILRPCVWHDAPFGKLMGVPTDGKAVTSWANHDEAFADVTLSIKNVAQRQSSRTVTPQPRESAAPAVQPTASGLGRTIQARSSNLRLRQEFTERDRDRFLHDSFEHFAEMFQGSLTALEERNAGIESDFRRVDANTFTATIYREGKKVGECCVRLGGLFGKGIAFSNDANPQGNSFNESLSVDADDQALYFTSLGFAGARKSRLSREAAAEYLWAMLIERLQ